MRTLLKYYLLVKYGEAYAGFMEGLYWNIYENLSNNLEE